jgi:hypothetical protein
VAKSIREWSAAHPIAGGVAASAVFLLFFQWPIGAVANLLQRGISNGTSVFYEWYVDGVVRRAASTNQYELTAAVALMMAILSVAAPVLVVRVYLARLRQNRPARAAEQQQEAAHKAPSRFRKFGIPILFAFWALSSIDSMTTLFLAHALRGSFELAMAAAGPAMTSEETVMLRARWATMRRSTDYADLSKDLNRLKEVAAAKIRETGPPAPAAKP